MPPHYAAVAPAPSIEDHEPQQGTESMRRTVKHLLPHGAPAKPLRSLPTHATPPKHSRCTAAAACTSTEAAK
ncbi:hypothetical protein GUJ93_ZPchr0008g12118 [Zizania palustris]|uniref:Uncharacterized protein n=1 Tax=Zizania palustris TaxID=103762 RepID=A0A8J5RJD4_ZIZPA|nr:hypothetical protein GUJ93_ZPchr0008g12118 [Zizania palustris]